MLDQESYVLFFRPHKTHTNVGFYLVSKENAYGIDINPSALSPYCSTLDSGSQVQIPLRLEQ